MNSVSADSLRQNIILVFITCGLLLFLGLSARELSDDEAVIAFRAKATAGKSAWTDQSAFTPGGVMNATQAPLQVWAEMLFVRTAGWTKPFMLRVWSVLCGVAALVLVYRIAAYRLPPSEALAAPVLLAGSLVWNDVARSAISAVPVVTFLLLAFVAAIEATAGTPVHASGAADPWRRRAWSCVYAVAVCCSLLLDTVFGCMALVLLLGVRRRGVRELLFGAIAGVLLSLPWFVHMTVLHGSPALRAALASSLLLRDAAGVPVGAGVMNLTGLIASQPLVIIAIIGLALSWRRGRSEDESHAGSAQETMLRVWAVAGMALCALPVPGHVAVVFVVPVLAILAVTQRTSVFRTASSTRMLTGAFLFLLLLVLVRIVTYAGSIHHPDADLSVLSVVSALFLATGAARIIPRHRVSRFNGFMIRQTRMLVPALLVIHCGWYNTSASGELRDGAKEVSAWLEQSQQRMFTVIVDSENPADTLVPQLAWYTQGWAGFARSQPWRPANGCTVLRLTGEATADSVALAVAERRDEPIVYVRPDRDPYEYADPSFGRSPERKDTRRYVVYSRVAYTTDMEDDD